jgi:signal transduction histidine kinase
MYLQVDISTITKAVYIASGITVFLVVLIVMFIVLYRKSHNYYLKEKELMNAEFKHVLLESQIEVQEATYSSLGKELHDNIGQLLSSAKMLIGITERGMHEPPETLTSANQTLGHAINELRSLSKSLNKEWLEQFNLLENLKMEADRINPAKQVQIHLSHPERIDLITDHQLILFRIMQEAIHNAIKHSGATDIFVTIKDEPSLLQVSIHDNGNGLKSNDSNGVGIINMQQRVALLGGKMELINTSQGLNVEIILPVKRTL